MKQYFLTLLLTICYMPVSAAEGFVCFQKEADTELRLTQTSDTICYDQL